MKNVQTLPPFTFVPLESVHLQSQTEASTSNILKAVDITRMNASPPSDEPLECGCKNFAKPNDTRFLNDCESVLQRYANLIL